MSFSISGVPKLNRSEIVAACEDFSNIIGSFSEGTVYKGTLSSGVEIAVTSSAVKSRADWSKSSEEQFRKKVYSTSFARPFCIQNLCPNVDLIIDALFALSDRKTVQSEPQELCEPHWLL